MKKIQELKLKIIKMNYSKISLLFIPKHIFILKYRYDYRKMENDYWI